MKTTRTIFIVLLALSLCGIAYGGPLEDHVFDLVNLHRVANGSPELARSVELDRAAFRHSTDMATVDFMNHTGSDGSTAGQRITAAGYRWFTYGENIAAGWRTAEQVMAAWMASPGHRANILNPRFREIGISVVYRPGSRWDYYWTQDFGARNVVPPIPPPPPPPVPPVPTPIPVPVPTPEPTPPVPPAKNPSLVSLLPRIARSGVTVVTLAGSSFGSVRGTSKVTIHKIGTPVYAAVTYRTWADRQITLTFQTPQRGFHFVRVVRGDGRKSVSVLLYIR